MDTNTYNKGTHSETGVDLTQIYECLALSHTERLRRLEENTKSQQMLNRLANDRLVKSPTE